MRFLSRYSFTLLLKGAAMGACDVVPGVSGGTMAFLLEIYDELIESIRTFGRIEFLRAVFTLRWKKVFGMINFKFLIPLGSGIFLAVLGLAHTVEYLLENQPLYLWSFFFGLVLASAVTVSSRIRHWSIGLICALLLGTAAAYKIVGMVPVETPTAPWFLVLSGAIAICAMILPGISGSFILVLLGKYEYILNAVNQRDIFTIAYVAVGCGIGLILFAQILGWFLRKYHDYSVAVLTGFMIGSMRKIWPWKLPVVVEGEDGAAFVTDLNILPALHISGSFQSSVVFAVLFMIVGFVVVIGIDRWVHRKKGVAAAHHHS